MQARRPSHPSDGAFAAVCEIRAKTPRLVLLSTDSLRTPPARWACARPGPLATLAKQDQASRQSHPTGVRFSQRGNMPCIKAFFCHHHPGGHLAAARGGQSNSSVTTVGQAVDQIVAREHDEVAVIRRYSPIVETYVQDMKPDPEMGIVPVRRTTISSARRSFQTPKAPPRIPCSIRRRAREKNSTPSRISRDRKPTPTASSRCSTIRRRGLRSPAL